MEDATLVHGCRYSSAENHGVTLDDLVIAETDSASPASSTSLRLREVGMKLQACDGTNARNGEPWA